MHKNLKWKVILIVFVILICIYKLIPFKNALTLGLDLQGGTYLTLQVQTETLPEEQRKDATSRVLEIIRNRIDEFGVAEPIIQRGSGDRIIIQIPGVGTEGSERIKNIIKKQAHLEFRLVVDDADKLKRALAGEMSSSFKNEYEVLYEEREDEVGNKKSIPMLLTKEVFLTGDRLTDARVSYSSSGFGEVVVSIEFDKIGARRFAKITEENTGKKLAIVLDGKIQSAPVVNEKIPNGKAVISGSFSQQGAADLAISLRAGALPAPIKFIQETTVGPSLGSDSIRKGIKSCLLGFIVVAIFMTIYYLLSGVVANFALMLNVLILLALLSYFHATLTLPGIAGVILTIGMAVDANVIIFERIREELELGKTARFAIDAGYKKAFWTIFDSNLTTLITAFVLFIFGTGPIKGFAVTLTIGIIVSMFTALYVTKVIFDIAINNFKMKKLSI